MTYTLNFDGQDIAFNAQEKDADLIKKIITGLLTSEGFVNIDADDVKTVVDGAENVIAGEGIASGKNMCADAANEALKNLKDAKNVKGLLLSVTSGPEIALAELTDAAAAVEEVIDPDAFLIWGHVIDEAMEDAVKVSIVAAVQA